MEERKFYVARDENNDLFLYFTLKKYLLKRKDEEDTGYWVDEYTDYILKISTNLYPEVKWEDEEPTEVEITVK